MRKRGRASRKINVSEKKRKSRLEELPEEKNTTSRLEELPEDILIKIISLLRFNEAVRMSVVSHRWKHLWKRMPNLHLDAIGVLPVETGEMIHSRGLQYLENFNPLEQLDYDLAAEITQDFVHNVDIILCRHLGIGVKRLAISFNLDGRGHAFFLDRWVSFAVRSRTKEFVLSLNLPEYVPENRYNFPCNLFLRERDCPLEHLELCWCSIGTFQKFDGFKNLISLNFDSVNITDKVIRNLLSKCVMLKKLDLFLCNELVDLEIPNPLFKLELLTIHYCTKLKKVDFSAPSLSSLHYWGKQVPLIFRGALLLEKATIIYHTPLLVRDIDQLHDLPYLKTLQLNLCLSEVCDLVESRTQLIHLKHLELFVSEKQNLAHIASSLVKAAPFLETFSIRLSETQAHELDSKKLGPLPENRLGYLKTFEMAGFTGCPHQIKLLSFILTNASQLEVMIICFRVEVAREMFNKKLCPQVPEHVRLVLR